MPDAGTPERKRGAIPTLLGVGIILAATVFVVLLLSPQRGTPRFIAHEKICMAHLKQIGLGCMIYGAEHNDLWPVHEAGPLASLSLLYDGCLDDMGLFVCPATGVKVNDVRASSTLTTSDCGYEYLPGAYRVALGPDAPADLIIAYDKTPVHGPPKAAPDGSRRVVLFADAHVEAMAEPEFQKRLNRSKQHYEALRGQAPAGP